MCFFLNTCQTKRPISCRSSAEYPVKKILIIHCVNLTDMNRSACPPSVRTAGGGDVIRQCCFGLTPLIAGVLQNQNQRTTEFKPFRLTANERSCSMSSLGPRPISHVLLFVVGDDMKILLLLLKAAEGLRGWGGQGRLGGVDRNDNLTFSPPVFNIDVTARCVESGHVGEYGRTEASSHDQPVCFDGWLRRRSGKAAPPGGPLAVRGECEGSGVHLMSSAGRATVSSPRSSQLFPRPRVSEANAS